VTDFVLNRQGSIPEACTAKREELQQEKRNLNAAHKNLIRAFSEDESGYEFDYHANIALSAVKCHKSNIIPPAKTQFKDVTPSSKLISKPIEGTPPQASKSPPAREGRERSTSASSLYSGAWGGIVSPTVLPKAELSTNASQQIDSIQWSCNWCSFVNALNGDTCSMCGKAADTKNFQSQGISDHGVLNSQKDCGSKVALSDKTSKFFSLVNTGIKASSLKGVGYSAEELRVGGYAAAELISGGNWII
jgi:hypothetical protein